MRQANVAQNAMTPSDEAEANGTQTGVQTDAQIIGSGESAGAEVEMSIAEEDVSIFHFRNNTEPMDVVSGMLTPKAMLLQIIFSFAQRANQTTSFHSMHIEKVQASSSDQLGSELHQVDDAQNDEVAANGRQTGTQTGGLGEANVTGNEASNGAGNVSSFHFCADGELIDFVGPLLTPKAMQPQSMSPFLRFMKRTAIVLSFPLRLAFHRPIKRQKLAQKSIKSMKLKMRPFQTTTPNQKIHEKAVQVKL